MFDLRTIAIASMFLVAPFSSIRAEAAPTQTNDPLCFIQTKEGKVIDLSYMCGFQSPEICQLAGDDNSPKSSLLRDFCQKRQKCELDKSCNDQPFPNFVPDQMEPQGAIAPFIFASR